MIVYIAGKISGVKDYKQEFQKAEERLTAMGHTVLNPTILPEGLNDWSYLPICMAMIEQADMVYLLDNWQDSEGATIERKYAIYQGKLVVDAFELVGLE